MDKAFRVAEGVRVLPERPLNVQGWRVGEERSISITKRLWRNSRARGGTARWRMIFFERGIVVVCGHLIAVTGLVVQERVWLVYYSNSSASQEGSGVYGMICKSLRL